MTLKKNLFILLIIVNSLTYAQNKYAIACDSFTLNSKVKKDAMSVRRYFEKIIAMNEYPFTLVERDRDKINSMFEILKSEKFYKQNFNNANNGNLDFLGLDYLISGDITTKYGEDNAKIYIEFTCVSNNRVSNKFPLYFTISKDFLEPDNIEEKFVPILSKEIKVFVDTYFVGFNQPLRIKQKPEIIDRLEKSDSTVNELKKENLSIRNILNYQHEAKLCVTGFESEGGGFTNELTSLMSQAIEQKDNGYFPKSDSTAEKALDLAISKYPRFPFSFYFKAAILSTKPKSDWLIYAKKALEILNITTTINGHNPQHDIALKNVKDWLGLK
jgi:hypothetical protein